MHELAQLASNHSLLGSSGREVRENAHFDEPSAALRHVTRRTLP